MDQPGLDDTLHATALDGLRRINWFSRSSASLWGEIRRLDGADPGAPLRVLDVGCGGGDLLVQLRRRARADGCAIRFEGCDASGFAVEYARRHADRSRVEGLRFFRHDVLAGPLPDEYDVVMCSLFLHHFDEGDAVEVLARLRAAARRRVIVQDLCRTRSGYVLAWAGCRLLARSKVVHVDGPLSVAGAFTPDEAATLARRAGLERIRTRRVFPQRFVLIAAPEPS